MKRWLFAVKQGWIERKNLKRFLVEPAKQISHLSEITPEKLDGSNIAILVLDFDGVLAAHDAPIPSPEVERWLRQLTQHIGEQRVAILTNKPKKERLRYFKQHFPCIHMVVGVRKKPYPDGLLEVINYKGVPPHRVALVDDRILTGMLASCLTYSQGWYIRKPARNFWAHPFKETFFSILRMVERWVFKKVK